MNAMSLPSQSYVLGVIGKELRLSFSSVLLVPAAREIDLDTWRVTIVSDCAGAQSDPVTFTQTTGMGHRVRLNGDTMAKAPDPSLVLGKIASDLSLYLLLPSASGPAIDFLFTEGYATWPSECVTLHSQLVMTAHRVGRLLAVTDIPLSMFTLAITAATAHSVRHAA